MLFIRPKYNHSSFDQKTIDHLECLGGNEFKAFIRIYR